jgi:hypothetical protein
MELGDPYIHSAQTTSSDYCNYYRCARQGLWRFYSGTYSTRARITNLEDAGKVDLAVKEVADLPKGYSATLNAGDSRWMRSPVV